MTGTGSTEEITYPYRWLFFGWMIKDRFFTYLIVFAVSFLQCIAQCKTLWAGGFE